MVSLLRSRASILGAVVSAGALLAVSVPAAFAWEGPITEGPPALTEDSPTGYFVWHNTDGFHLRTHGPAAEHKFVARLHTDGKFTDVDAVKLEKDDKLKIKDDGHTLVLRFHTYDGFDGVNFHIDGGHKLRLNLKLDGKEAPLSSIYLGEDGAHPKSDPFTIDRR